MSEDPSTICGNNTHSISAKQFTRTRYFRRKMQFDQLSSPRVQKLGDNWTPKNIPRKFVSGGGDPATKTSGIAMTTLEFVGERGRVKNDKVRTARYGTRAHV